jgi:drug/metabolite transporter (DMT)-like permease
VNSVAAVLESQIILLAFLVQRCRNDSTKINEAGAQSGVRQALRQRYSGNTDNADAVHPIFRHHDRQQNPNGSRMAATIPTAATSLDAASGHLRGVLLTLAAGFVFVILDATGKQLTASLSISEITWGRCLFHMLALPLFLGGQSLRQTLHAARPGLQLVRSALLLGSTFFFFWGVKYLPLADATAVGFVTPLLVTGLSVPLLGERVGFRRWTAVAIGFASVVLIMQPGSGMVHWAVSLPLACAACFALYQIATRILSRHDSTATTYFYSPVVGLVATSLVLLFVEGEWRMPNLTGWLALVFLGAVGGFAHYLLIRAFAVAPASLLAPFGYAQLIWSIGIGYAWFGDFPDASTLAGAALISASGLYVLYRERRVAPAGPAAAAAPPSH